MTKFLLKDLLRSSSLVAGLGLLLVAGLLSLYIGGLFLDRQEETMALTAEAQKEGLDHQLAVIDDDDLGLLLYYVRFGMVNELPRLAGLSIGHRDVHPAAQNVNIRNLEEQRHVSVLSNPVYQLLGNLDFSFVLIFLFPLVIIGLCFNLLSEEREGGTWSLVLGQVARPKRVLWQKLLLRFAVVQAILLLLLLIGNLYLRIPFDAAFLAFGAVAVLYVSFWFSLSWLVVRLGRSSSQSALSLLLAWVLLTVVAPSAVNALVVNLYPVPEAYEAMLESRDGYHNKWDEPKEPTIQTFKAIYPQYADYEHPEGKSFGWFWYYAMQHMGDAAAAGATAALHEKLTRRDRLSRVASYLIPTAHTQLTLNAVSHADLTNYLAFQEHLAKFHENKRLAFYPKVFGLEAVSSVDWSAHGTKYFRDERRVEWGAILLPLLLASALLLFLARRRTIPTHDEN